jgi:hypothetical protein
MITLLSIASVLATLLNVTVIFGAGYVTAYYIQYLKNKKSNITLNEKPKEA